MVLKNYMFLEYLWYFTWTVKYLSVSENTRYPLCKLSGKCENYVSFAVVNTQVLHCVTVSKKENS